MSQAWAAAYERSRRGGTPVPPIAPCLIAVGEDEARCCACGERLAADEASVQRHGYRCPTDPWPVR